MMAKTIVWVKSWTLKETRNIVWFYSTIFPQYIQKYESHLYTCVILFRNSSLCLLGNKYLYEYDCLLSHAVIKQCRAQALALGCGESSVLLDLPCLLKQSKLGKVNFKDESICIQLHFQITFYCTFIYYGYSTVKSSAQVAVPICGPPFVMPPTMHNEVVETLRLWELGGRGSAKLWRQKNC